MPEPATASMTTVIRCMDIGRSRLFYEILLGFRVTDEWDEGKNHGCLLALGDGPACLELSEIDEDDARYRAEFGRPLEGDKLELQLRVPALDTLERRLRGRWDVEGPEPAPWGPRWMRLRDPDGIQVALIEHGAA